MFEATTPCSFFDPAKLERVIFFWSVVPLSLCSTTNMKFFVSWLLYTCTITTCTLSEIQTYWACFLQTERSHSAVNASFFYFAIVRLSNQSETWGNDGYIKIFPLICQILTTVHVIKIELKDPTLRLTQVFFTLL